MNTCTMISEISSSSDVITTTMNENVCNAHNVQQQNEETMPNSSSSSSSSLGFPPPPSSSSLSLSGVTNNNDDNHNDDNDNSLQQAMSLHKYNHVKDNTEECASTSNRDNTNGDTVSSTEQCCCNSIKRRSWSMLELNEMKVIHGLQDDMEEILSLETNEEDEEEDVNCDYDGDEKDKNDQIREDDFLFIDCDVDEDEDEDPRKDRVDSSRHVVQNIVPTTGSEWPVTGSCASEQHKRNRGKNKLQRGILKNLGFRRSMSMGVLLQSDNGGDDDDDDDDDDDLILLSQPSVDPPCKGVSSLDHSHHDHSNHRGGMNLGRILQEGYSSHSTPSPLSITEYEEEPHVNDLVKVVVDDDDDHHHLRQQVKEDVVASPAKRTLSRNRMNRISPSSNSCRTLHQPPTVTSTATTTTTTNTNTTTTEKDPLPAVVPVFRHCRERMPQSSILKKSTSMVHLSSSSNSSTIGPDPTHPCTNLTKSSGTDGKMKRVTSFSTLEIREYNVTIGDNPGGRQGPPLSLDWNYCEDRTLKIDIDRYEQMRAPRRKKHEMYMPGNIRMWTLMKYLGYSLREIEDASKAADLIRKKRAKSIKYQNIYDLQYRVGKLLKIGRR